MRYNEIKGLKSSMINFFVIHIINKKDEKNMINQINSKSEQTNSILTVSNATSAAINIVDLMVDVPLRVLDSVILNPLCAGFSAQGLNDISAVQTFNHISKQQSGVKNGYTGLVALVQGLIQLPALILGFLVSILPRAYNKFSSSNVNDGVSKMELPLAPPNALYGPKFPGEGGPNRILDAIESIFSPVAK